MVVFVWLPDLAVKTDRPGTYDYYMSEPVVEDDAKGVGPFLTCLYRIITLQEKLVKRYEGV